MIAVGGLTSLRNHGPRALADGDRDSAKASTTSPPADPPPIENDPYGAFVAPTLPLTALEEQKKFHLPPGFEIQLVVSEPTIHKPMNLNFDSRGRLWVTHSVEYPFPAKDRPGKDRLSVLSDFGPDGHARRAKVFAEGLNIPIGVVPVPGGAIAYSVPIIYYFEDTNGDGKADRRTPFYESIGSISFTDTHGMTNSFTRWIDGWIYACHGFSNTSQLHGRDGQKIVMQSGNVYRMRADGSHLEFFTHGQVNPFGLAFDPLGNLYSSDCHTKPLYMLLRGAWYPSFGKPHDGLGFGPTMIDHLHGSTGIAGVVYYAAKQFPPEYRDTVFIGNPVTGRVNHDRLESHGSSYRAIKQPDFISCDDPWFRPVDLQLGPDGALYIADFYNCIIGHYEVPLTHPRRDRRRGRIWRVVYTGAATATLEAPPNLHDDSLDELISRLADPNLTVRVLATNEICDRFGKDATTAVARVLSEGATPFERSHAIWIVERFGGLSAAQIERLARDPERMVRIHLAKALAERGAWDSATSRLAQRMLRDEDPFVRRAAADALGRHPRPENVPLLLNLWQSTAAEDTHLIHVARMALRDHLRLPGAYEKLGPLANDPKSAWRLANVSLGVHDSPSATFILRYLTTEDFDRGQLGTLLHYAARYIDESQWPSIFAYAEVYEGAGVDDQVTVVRALHQAAQERSKPLPDGAVRWAKRLIGQLLADEHADQIRKGVDLARQFGLKEAYDQLRRVALDRKQRVDVRRAALDTCVGIDGERTLSLLSNLLGNPDEAILLKQQAANQLGALNRDTAREVLLRHLQSAPSALAARIAQALCKSPAGGERLLAAIEQGKASPRLLRETGVQRRLKGLAIAHRDERIAKLTAQLPATDNRIHDLIKQCRGRFAHAEKDPRRGAEVFKKVCAACHRIGDEGHKIGPELDGIGLRGLDRLLEDMLDPSRNVDQAFRATLLTTDDGQVLTGLVLREEGDVLVLVDSQGKEIRVPTAQIDEREVSPLSPMPANVTELVSPDDLNHLLAYLLSQKQARDQQAAK